ncbi:104 kDa microneme/rhoptry antigen [Frankliniella fusca]|uniref:104 kDa microneme/rhoptry antigen n=1 Tax=Frankliniella fusca TaxID=407009 RepID=A0AAE1LH86_9NEOP|nr:104 kDa microneme/rhoptry antigen [Frankliniella fusca]
MSPNFQETPENLPVPDRPNRDHIFLFQEAASETTASTQNPLFSMRAMASRTSLESSSPFTAPLLRPRSSSRWNFSFFWCWTVHIGRISTKNSWHGIWTQLLPSSLAPNISSIN